MGFPPLSNVTSELFLAQKTELSVKCLCESVFANKVYRLLIISFKIFCNDNRKVTVNSRIRHLVALFKDGIVK